MRAYLHVVSSSTDEANAFELRFLVRAQPQDPAGAGEVIDVAPEYAVVLADGEPLTVTACEDDDCLRATGTVEPGATVSIAAVGLPDYEDPIPVRIRAPEPEPAE